MPKDHTAIVLSRRDYDKDAYYLDLQAPELAAAIEPGQFFMAEVPGPGSDPLLRRPFGYLDLDREAGRLGVLVRRVGRGTRILGRVQPGQELRLLGPLGRGWTLPTAGPVLLVAGGIGIAPLFDLAARSADKLETVMVYGARCGEELHALDQLARLPVQLILATDDGTCGVRGTVMEPLSRLELSRFTGYYACGPRPMLAGVQIKLAAAGVPGELSLEERMACGFGACLGCAVAVKDTTGGTAYKRVCVDGPVFPAEEVVFDANA